jgi:hypothetical protein
MHATQEELEGKAQGGLVDPGVPIILGDCEYEAILGYEESAATDSEPLPHEFPACEAPEELPEEFVPKRKKSKK